MRVCPSGWWASIKADSQTESHRFRQLKGLRYIGVECWVPQMLLKASLAFWIAPLLAQVPTAPSPPATQSSNVPAPQVNPKDSNQVPVAVDSKTYTIGPTDVIRVEAYNYDTFTRNLVVRPDGKITLPLIGDVQAGGLTPDRLGAQIQEAAAQYLRNPDITVSVLQVNSRTYTISGLMTRTGTFPLVKSVKVFEALNMAGSFMDFANKSKIIIARGDKRIPFNYNDVLDGKNLKQNIELEPGDTIIVK
jgi:polysaccharide export outer membrane protein